jgi:hypothetical protein
MHIEKPTLVQEVRDPTPKLELVEEVKEEDVDGTKLVQSIALRLQNYDLYAHAKKFER